MNRVYLVAYVFVAVAALLFVADTAAEHRARGTVLRVVEQTRAVLLDGNAVDDPQVILQALRSLGSLPNHHSSPAGGVRLELAGEHGTLDLAIARDSQEAEEFWVFIPGANLAHSPFGQSVGGVRSQALDRYLRQRGL